MDNKHLIPDYKITSEAGYNPENARISDPNGWPVPVSVTNPALDIDLGNNDNPAIIVTKITIIGVSEVTIKYTPFPNNEGVQNVLYEKEAVSPSGTELVLPTATLIDKVTVIPTAAEDGASFYNMKVGIIACFKSGMDF